jgi:glyoxylase-like metal-dependent hydrolase (beta-lactamase superfamily II)
MAGVVQQRKRLAAFLTVSISICVLIFAVHWSRRWNVPLLDGSTITVVPGIHLLGGLGPSAAYAIETPKGLILVDSGLDSDARPLTAELAKLGLNSMKLHGIFLTHVHGDHCGGAEQLRAATGATVYAGQEDAAFLKSGLPREAFFSTFKMPDHTPHPTTVDVELKGGERIDFGDVHVHVLEAPGHTPGSTCYLIDRGGWRVLFSGDVIQRLDENPFGTYSAYLAPRYRGDAVSYLATLRKLQSLPVPDLVLPGHPRDNSTPQSPQLTPQRWEAMLDRGIHEMDQLVARYTADGADFLDGHPKRLLPDLYYLGDFQGSAMPPPEAVAGTYVGPDGNKIKVAALTAEDRRAIVRWIDLGCPIDLDFDPKEPQRLGHGWMLDDQRPTLTLTHPQPGANKKVDRILVGMHDYYSGLDEKSFQVEADFPIDGTPAGKNLASQFKVVNPGVWELKLSRPITELPKGKLTVSVQDLQGNVTRIERTFSVK